MDPIIVIGMHRSGTSIVTSSLNSLGLFTGSRLDANDESLFFLRINQWILRQCGASWDNPLLIDDNLLDDKSLAVFRDAVEREMGDMRRFGFLGFRRMFSYSSIAAIDFAWGWKDPRNAYTAMFWKTVFPDAKILHITRDGRDVARSVIERRDKSLLRMSSRGKRGLQSLKSRYRGVGDTMIINNVGKALNLWHRYERVASGYREHSGKYYMNVRYEDLLSNPVDQLSLVASFCHLQPSINQIEVVAAGISVGKSGKDKAINFDFSDEASQLLLNEFGY